MIPVNDTISDPCEEPSRTKEDFPRGGAISGGGLVQDKPMGIMARAHAAEVDHAAGRMTRTMSKGTTTKR